MARLAFGVCGGMGAGKSSLCARMAELHGWTWIEVDSIRRELCAALPPGGDFAERWEAVKPAAVEEARRLISLAPVAALLEWPMLAQDGFAPLLSKAIVADCPAEVRLSRLEGGDLPPDEVRARMARQPSSRECMRALEGLGVPATLLDTSDAPSDLLLRELGDELSESEHSSAHPHCLFRIPRKGGRAIWEVTNSCNYGCRYCIFSSTPRKPEGELGTRRALEVLDELAELGFTHVKFTGGEPMMRPDIHALLSRARALGLACDLSTNAALVGPAEADLLASHGLDMVHVSLDGPDKATQESIRGARTWDPTVAGIRALASRGVPVRVGCVVFSGNQDKILPTAQLCHDLGAREAIFSLMEPAGRMRGKESSPLLCRLPPEELRARCAKAASVLSGRIKVTGNFPGASTPGGCGSCPGGTRFLFIDHAGSVSPCTWASERAPQFASKGSLRDHALRDLVQGREVASFAATAKGLADAGLSRCPMSAPAAFSESAKAGALFQGDLAANLARGGRHSEASPAYACTNENLAEWMPLLRPRGRDLLLVGGAGDAAVAAISMGAASAASFDVSIPQRHFAELRRALLSAIGYEEHLDFLENFPHGAYLRARPLLSVEARHFLDLAWAHPRDGAASLAQGPLLRGAPPREMLRRCIPHLASQEAYMAARRACHGRPFQWATLPADRAAHATGSARYGAIGLSNLADYAHMEPGVARADCLAVFRDRVALPLAGQLLPGGTMMVAYCHDGADLRGSSLRSPVGDASERLRAFGGVPGLEYREARIASAWGGPGHDLACLWERAA